MSSKPSDLDRRPGALASRRLSFPARLLLVGLGTLCMGLAVLGIVLPLLPATPFLLGAAFCYARSSERLYSWLLRRKFIAKRLEELTIHKGLTAKSKWSIMGVAFTGMALAAILINKPAMYVVFGVLLGVKALYFAFGMKTIPIADRPERQFSLLKKSRMDREAEIVRQMIAIYCQGNHDVDGVLCTECTALLQYAVERLNHCRFGAEKPTCGKCPVCCYRPELRRKIQRVMRYSGPRMLIRRPGATIRHLIDSLIKKVPKR